MKSKEKSNLFENFLLLFILLSAIATLIIYIYFSFKRYFIGDDFPLLLSAKNLKSIFHPLGPHFRPIVRAHFLLSNIFGDSPVFFNFLSLILHLFATVSLYLVLKEEYNKKFSLFTSLIFFSLFAYNEAIFWVSSVGVVYSLLFSLLSIYYTRKEKYFLSVIFLLLSSFSYETWLVLPLYFLLSKKRSITLIISSITLLGFHSLFALFSSEKILSYGGFPPLDEIPLRILYYFYKNLFPFSYLSKGIFLTIGFLTFIALSLYSLIKYREKFLLPFLFYFVPSAIFLMSKYIPSRFFYFPLVSIATLLSCSIFKKKPWRYLSLPFIIYLSILSPVINYLDGLDYLEYSKLHRVFIDEGRRLMKDLKAGDKVVIVNRVSLPMPEIAENSVKGRPKLFLHRWRGIGGLIDLNVFTNFIFWEKGMKSTPIPGGKDCKIIIIGNGDFVSEYSFKVEEIK